MTRVDRREVLGGVIAASAMRLVPSAAWAVAPTCYSFRLGQFEISVISDGHLTIPTRFLARNVSESDIKTWLGQTADMMSPACNITLIRTPAETILIDVGAGPHFMPAAGKLAENMEAAGIDRKA